MVENYRMEGGNRGVNKSSAGSDPTDQKLLGNNYKNGSKPICRLYEQNTESIDHLVSGCPVLTLIKYKERHNKMGNNIH